MAVSSARSPAPKRARGETFGGSDSTPGAGDIYLGFHLPSHVLCGQHEDCCKLDASGKKELIKRVFKF